MGFRGRYGLRERMLAAREVVRVRVRRARVVGVWVKPDVVTMMGVESASGFQ